MKKRSLFAAVAMLIVSALVLTSATYAWFAVGGDADISAISADVCEAGSGVQLKTTATSAKWVNSLADTDFGAAGSSDSLASEYKPVSSAAGTAFKAYNLQTGNIYAEDTGTITGYYSTYFFYVGTVADGDSVDATLKISGDAAAAARVAVFVKPAGVSSWTDQSVTSYLYSGQAESNTCYAVVESVSGVEDTVRNDIMDGTTETPSTNLAAQSITSEADDSTGATFTITTPGQIGATNNAMVKVVVWLEGNDASCTAINVAEKDIATEWSFEVA